MSTKVVYESEAPDRAAYSGSQTMTIHHARPRSQERTMSRRLALLPATWSAFGWLACAANSEWEWAKLFGSVVVLLVVFALSAPGRSARKD